MVIDVNVSAAQEIYGEQQTGLKRLNSQPKVDRRFGTTAYGIFEGHIDGFRRILVVAVVTKQFNSFCRNGGPAKSISRPIASEDL